MFTLDSHIGWPGMCAVNCTAGTVTSPLHLRPEESMTLNATPLNNAHRALGARMVDFGGWDMPVNYGSQIE